MHKDGAADGYLPVPTEFFRVPRPADGLRGQRDPNPRGQEHRDPDGRRSHVLHVDGDDRLDDVEKPHRTAVEAVRVGGHGFGRPGSACTAVSWTGGAWRCGRSRRTGTGSTSPRWPAPGVAVAATPAHQFPTGVVLAADRCRELMEWTRAGGLVVEDDYDAEHRCDRPPMAALQGGGPGRRGTPGRHLPHGGARCGSVGCWCA